MLNASYAECHTSAIYTECLYAECHYAECRGATLFTNVEWFIGFILLKKTFFNLMTSHLTGFFLFNICLHLRPKNKLIADIP